MWSQVAGAIVDMDWVGTMDLETQRSIAKTLLNYGVLGTIVLCGGAFLGGIAWLFLRAIKRLLEEHVPAFFQQAMQTLETVSTVQVQLITMAKEDRATDRVIMKTLASKLDPRGDDWRDHVFSSSRIEGFLQELFELAEWFIARESDAKKRQVVKQAVAKMRAALVRSAAESKKKSSRKRVAK